jgi:hypothetical protein
MPTASYNKFQAWAENLAESVNAASDTFKIALLNTAPSATDSVLADITADEISYTNLTTSGAGGRALTTASSGHTSGTYKLDFDDITLTASGGSVGPFQYVVIYDDTPTSPADPLVCWFDYGSAITLAAGETLDITFNASGLYTIGP